MSGPELCERLIVDKAAVFAAAHRLLKPGGELYFSGGYADQCVPPALLNDPVRDGECLAGALYWGDFDRLVKATGFADPRLVRDRSLGIGDPAIADTLDGIDFHSATLRLFKRDGLKPQCENYGQAARYRGAVPGAARVVVLDDHHRIEAGRLFPVCGNTSRMLAETGLAPHLEFFGDFSTHYGAFAGYGASRPCPV